MVRVVMFHDLLHATLHEWQDTVGNAYPLLQLHDAFKLYRISNVPPHLCYRMVNYALAPTASAADQYLQQEAAAGKNEKAIV